MMHCLLELKRERHPEVDALPETLECKRDMVGKREQQVGGERIGQDGTSHVNNSSGELHDVRRERVYHLEVAGIDVIEGTLNASEVNGLIGNGAKADALSKGNQLATMRVLAHRHVVVYLSDDSHNPAPPSPANAP